MLDTIRPPRMNRWHEGVCGMVMQDQHQDSIRHDSFGDSNLSILLGQISKPNRKLRWNSGSFQHSSVQDKQISSAGYFLLPYLSRWKVGISVSMLFLLNVSLAFWLIEAFIRLRRQISECREQDLLDSVHCFRRLHFISHINLAHVAHALALFRWMMSEVMKLSYLRSY